MTADSLLDMLVAANVAGGLAILAVLLLRGPIRRLAGARFAYLSWLIVPAAIAATFLPAPTISCPAPAIAFASAPELPRAVSPAVPPPNAPVAALFGAMAVPIESASPPPRHDIDWAPILVIGWIIGALAAAAWLAIRQVRAVRSLGALTKLSPTLSRAERAAIGPAVVGIIAPRIVLPANFEATFDDTERRVVLAHEEAHLRGRHTAVKTLIELGVCLCWFNPLAYIAARAIAMDQEMTCDEAVAARYPADRKAYAGALLKTQTGPRLPLGCYWPAGSARALKDRIRRLGEATPSRTRRHIGAALILAASSGAGYAAWANQPPVAAPIEKPRAARGDAPQPAPVFGADEKQKPGGDWEVIPPGTAFPIETPQLAFEPQQPAPQAPRGQWDSMPVRRDMPAGFDPRPMRLRGKVERIEFSDTTYDVYVRGMSLEPFAPRAGVEEFPGTLVDPRPGEPNRQLWRLSTTHYWGDRAAVNKDLAGKFVEVRGFPEIDTKCAPLCHMHVLNISVPATTQVAPVPAKASLVTEFARYYDSNRPAYFWGEVELLEFSDRTFDAWVRVPGQVGLPDVRYQVRSEYRYPRADIEKALAGQNVYVSGYRARGSADGVCAPVCGVYAIGFRVGDTIIRPSGEEFMGKAAEESTTSGLGIPSRLGVFNATADPTAPLVISGKLVALEGDPKGDSATLVVEITSADPSNVAGGAPGTVWRVVGMPFAVDESWSRGSITVRGFNARDKSCLPSCVMAGATGSLSR